MTVDPMPGSELTFVDANVLAYAHDRSDPRKQSIAQGLLESLWQSESGLLSTQVLQEFYSVATRKFDPPMRPKAAREVVSLYGQWRIVPIDVALILDASRLEERHGLFFWDALIVEAARRAGASSIATEDLQPGRRFGRIAIENPFA